eukprot:CAMPEP_0197629332 /NCGR_PEP_ID=MMETSP1338-20131121/7230_1 /TAXON_ID=43686 ORGANISM="Pelagodinium beii, Strain RCC1491" /NCGR_SAMPLE_ID=MMETSP1338 /ASSEMBLY_ACC=CAM_ASM_000754 /LENGTH=83 /DNA_ID=CAMNT_0043200363 /DNA_START=783 /DNA_END=1034 /DNA_ORIENTATION=+
MAEENRPRGVSSLEVEAHDDVATASPHADSVNDDALSCQVWQRCQPIVRLYEEDLSVISDMVSRGSWWKERHLIHDSPHQSRH